MAKKELDKLSLDMIQCEKDGYGVHYGAWKATQPIAKPNTVEVLPDGWKLCAHCGKPFKPNVPYQKYCEALCGREAQTKRYKSKWAAYMKERRAKEKAEMGV